MYPNSTRSALSILRSWFAVASIVAAGTVVAQVSPGSNAALVQPLVSSETVFEEVGGIVAVEAEHFYKQTLTDPRAFYITSGDRQPELKPDADAPHLAGASGGAYIEILPDLRVTHDDPLVPGTSFSNDGGAMATVFYKVHFNQPGRYYVWGRVFSTGTEDNGVHVGIDGQWPESGKRWQTTMKHAWNWDSRQRTEQNHLGEPFGLYLDVPTAGVHEIMFSMREDGFEMDKWVLALSRDFKPQDAGPAIRIKTGKVPPAFTVAAVAPIHPAALTPLTGRAQLPGLSMNSQDFPVDGTRYYRDRNRWLAINPEQHREASTKAKFPHPPGRYDVTLHMVGESDGRSQFEVVVEEKSVGRAECPLSTEMFEEGEQFTKTWHNVDIDGSAEVEVHSQVASEDGREFSRARWVGLTFTPSKVQTTTTPKLPLVQPRSPDGKGAVQISGELKQWHKVTLTLDGPYAHELDNQPNPFTDYRLTVTFRHESGKPSYRVPGYFAADGRAGESGAESGTKWRAHLSPDKPGTWTYEVAFETGRHVAVEATPGKALKPYDGKSGRFTIGASDKSGADLRGKGRLVYNGTRYLRFAGTGEYFLKAGPDSPETFLGSADIDGTTAMKSAVPLKTWAAHEQDWREGDPTWRDGRGKGLFGSLNYLAAKGVNSFSFLTYNAGGDGDNVWPFAARDAKFNYDCSKLDQWGMVFDHAQQLGLHLHFKLQETEQDDQRRGPERAAAQIPEALDGGAIGPERRLYFRELIARFGHALALNWNLGEENTQTTAEQIAMAEDLRRMDPYDHHIVIHTYPQDQDKVYEPLLGATALTGVSLQNHWNVVHARTLKWIEESAKAGHAWVVANDEQGPASLGVPPDEGYQGFDGKAVERDGAYTMHDVRHATLWGNLMAGGAGVEYYFGYKLAQNDIIADDFRSRDRSWDYCRIAIQFFQQNKIPFWEMKNADALVGNEQHDNSRYCFAKAGELYLVYLPMGGRAELDLSGATSAGNRGQFSVAWFNPRTGGELQPASDVRSGAQVKLAAPSTEDWLAVVRRK